MISGSLCAAVLTCVEDMYLLFCGHFCAIPVPLGATVSLFFYFVLILWWGRFITLNCTSFYLIFRVLVVLCSWPFRLMYSLFFLPLLWFEWTLLEQKKICMGNSTIDINDELYAIIGDLIYSREQECRICLWFNPFYLYNQCAILGLELNRLVFSSISLWIHWVNQSDQAHSPQLQLKHYQIPCHKDRVVTAACF